MMSVASAVLLATALLLIAIQPNAGNHFDDHHDWEHFKRRHGKKYDSEDTERRHRSNLASRIARVAAHNDRFSHGLESFTEALNEFSDLDESEFNFRMNGFRPDRKFMERDERREVSDSDHFITKRQTLPATVDWRTKGAVTPVQNQGMCGSCWAFSATGALEGQTLLKTGKLPSLSEQNLLDCAGSSYGNSGCNGGCMNCAFNYVANNKGIASEAGYPYVGYVKTCSYNRAYNSSTCKGTNWVSQSESALMKAVATAGPISVAVDASAASFQTYSSGVYNNPSCSSTNLNHGVLVVGYGTLNGVPYWLIKNRICTNCYHLTVVVFLLLTGVLMAGGVINWGTSWGMNGYMYLARNANNMCGVATYAVWPAL